MSKKFKNKYRIESARKKNYDYSSVGAYFLTIMTGNREHFFGEVVINDENAINYVSLSASGKIAQKYWNEIPQHFPFIRLDEMVVMPNHIHGILWIENTDGVKGETIGYTHDRRYAINRVSTVDNEMTIDNVPVENVIVTPIDPIEPGGGITGKHNPMFYDNISRVIRWYKGRCTYEINKCRRHAINRVSTTTKKFSWQARFHDRIIRDDTELNRIRIYIQNNPQKWQGD